jgi:hypothetical protein
MIARLVSVAVAAFHAVDCTRSDSLGRLRSARSVMLSHVPPAGVT